MIYTINLTIKNQDTGEVIFDSVQTDVTVDSPAYKLATSLYDESVLDIMKHFDPNKLPPFAGA